MARTEAGQGMGEWGWVEPHELARVVVVSPHPDDAVLSCGQFLSRHLGTTVVTVFCGFPARYPDPPNRWAQLSGFVAGNDIVALRRAEDVRALGRLGATAVHLDGFAEADLQPDEPVATAEHVADGLDPVLRDLAPTLVLLPLGLANPEHVTVHDAALLLRERWSTPHTDTQPAPEWIAYQDVAYHHIPGLLAWRVSKLFRSGLWPTPVAMPLDPDLVAKRAAIAEYPSQVKALEADWQLWRRIDAPTPEQYWRLAPPPTGWEGLADT
ncbi:MAG TPA: PIG-L family deacetylase [Acidimicrobiales bacterium]